MSETDPRQNIEKGEAIVVRQLAAEDIDSLVPVIEEWVRDSETGQVIHDEVADIASKMTQSVTGESADRQYLVAEQGGNCVGVMGLAFPTELMKQYARTENPIEIVNAFVSGESQGQGVGSELLSNALALSEAIGASEVMVNSGPRYKETAWGFYDKTFEGRIATLKDHYGPGLDAPVWSKLIQPSAN